MTSAGARDRKSRAGMSHGWIQLGSSRRREGLILRLQPIEWSYCQVQMNRSGSHLSERERQSRPSGLN